MHGFKYFVCPGEMLIKQAIKTRKFERQHTVKIKFQLHELDTHFKCPLIINYKKMCIIVHSNLIVFIVIGKATNLSTKEIFITGKN